jgi:hypothetical protein
LGGRLFQQYIVDQFASIEQSRLMFLRYNQTKLRAELYSGLQDALRDGENELARVGKLIVLPSSFTGGPRYMNENYHDSMAIVRRFGKPDLFITMTCNPNWPEIVAVLLPHQKPEDRPDLITRYVYIQFKGCSI